MFFFLVAVDGSTLDVVSWWIMCFCVLCLRGLKKEEAIPRIFVFQVDPTKSSPDPGYEELQPTFIVS